MYRYPRFPKLSLIILICIVFNSCAKDIDLISEFVIRNVESVENNHALQHTPISEAHTVKIENSVTP
ncbi:hypothetical protein EJ994_00465 [Maribacter sp. MJ134]|uniref:hypothetical protein n=1 Tax=Maribacter sp. MJ134 TaxID=2496865 RepID=UPI000F833614|nr:hypothetical protein [Maribacter sp. MJ134]AZQ57352.1 hypothetical protein EJ994_00465 [Maribacter sp. MJ134]